MGGLRAKDRKPKKVNDFKKVKTKVGKKVARGTATVINVKSKKIIISAQKGLQEKESDENLKIAKFTRQFHHHSASTRLSALSGIKEIFATSDRAESYIALVIPAALELLFDEEGSTRKALLNFINSLTKKYSGNAFRGIAPIVTSYCCSGLTSLTKEIRHDSLVLLLEFLDAGTSTIFMHDLCKLLQHVSGLLSLASHSGSNSQPRHTAGATKSLESRSKRKNENSKNANIERSSFLVSNLQVLEALIKLASASNKVNSCFSQRLHTDLAAADEMAKGNLLIYPIKSVSVSAEKKSVQSTMSSESSEMSRSGALSLRNLFEDICCRLTPIWNGLVHEGSSIDNQALHPLRLISRICVLLSDLIPFFALNPGASTSTAYENLLVSLFSGYPYFLFEVTVATPGSKEEEEYNKRANDLNISISEAALIWCNHSRSFTHVTVSNSTDLIVKRVEDSPPESAIVKFDVKYYESTLDYVNSSLSTLSETMSQNTNKLGQLFDDKDEYLDRFFNCLSLEVLYFAKDVSGIELSSVSLKEDSIVDILRNLSRLIELSVDILPKFRMTTPIRIQLTRILQSSVDCASCIVSSEVLMEKASSLAIMDNVSQLILTLSRLPLRMISKCSLGRPSDDERVVYTSLSTLLHFLQRCGGYLEESDTYGVTENAAGFAHLSQNWGDINDQVSTHISCLFSESIEFEDDADCCVGYMQCNYSTRMLLLDVWYYCQFVNFDDVVEDSISAIAGNSGITSSEQEKMLYVIYLRRNEMNISTFVSSLLRGFEISAEVIHARFLKVKRQSVADTSMTILPDHIKSFLLHVGEQVLSSSWYIRKIAYVLYQCGSSNSPHLIAKHVVIELRNMVADMSYSETDCYYYCIGVLTLLQTLLAPFVVENEMNTSFLLKASVVKLESPICKTNIEVAEGLLYHSTEIAAEFILMMLLCDLTTGEATTRILKLGFQQLREGVEFNETMLHPVLCSLGTQWMFQCESNERNACPTNTAFIFDVMVFLLDKIECRIQNVIDKDKGALLFENIFEIVQYWKLREDMCFERHKSAILEYMKKWCNEEYFASDETLCEIVESIINLVN